MVKKNDDDDEEAVPTSVYFCAASMSMSVSVSCGCGFEFEFNVTVARVSHYTAKIGQTSLYVARIRSYS